ncbi:aldo/keto reductase [Ihubacter sp. mB4P-1]|uniref:aldo/keto reductase n=1 Tax=Ihubacter sp. mB4P-1 TaxID=3242370 RepID=UPI003C7A15D6
MIYKAFQDLKLSALGFGAMRLPVVAGKDADIDKDAASAMVAEAMRQGINYYDTAWGYHEGNSELVMGEIFSAYPRDSFYLATKFPGYDLSNMNKVEEIFEKQLEKCRVEYFDFYLFHNVCEMNIEDYLDERHGIYDYLMEQKRNGRIRHLGFSAHGETPVMRRFLEKYGKDMEFCQIQLNYLDLRFQDAQAKLELLKEYDIPVWVMEPLRGGRLAKLSTEEIAKLADLRPDETPVAWAFRFLQSIPQVTMVLSGMSNMEQLTANVDTYTDEKPLNEEEQKALQEIAEAMAAKVALPCTSCRYCTSHCPQGLDIPYLLSLYNEHRSTTEVGGMSFIAPMALSAVEKEKLPSACIGCGSCEAVCPQQIKISQAMQEFSGMLGM